MLLLALVCAGCKQAELDHTLDRPARHPGSDSLSRNGREWDMNQQWQNRRFSDLRAALGIPQLIMNIPGGGNPPGFVAVYGHDAKTGCIDAFALFGGGGPDPVIRVYHCR